MSDDLDHLDLEVFAQVVADMPNTLSVELFPGAGVLSYTLTVPALRQLIALARRTLSCREGMEANEALVMEARAERDAALARQAELETALRGARREHYECDDCWYSCPKSPDGCCNDEMGDECSCGADKFNAAIDALLGGDTTDRGGEWIEGT